MATIDQLEVQIKADIADLKRRLDEAKSRLMGLKDSGTTAAQGVAKVGTTSRQAGAAIVNFNRVVQDAPFGLIAIQNNIEPLFTSFQHLSASAGGARAAMGIMAKSLLGPAGLIAGLTLVVALLPRIIQKFKDAKKSADELGKAVSGIIKKEDIGELQAEEAGLRRALSTVNQALTAFEGTGETVRIIELARQGMAKLTPETQRVADAFDLLIQSGIVPTKANLEALKTTYSGLIDENNQAQQAFKFTSNFLEQVAKKASTAKTKIDEVKEAWASLMIFMAAAAAPGFEGGKAPSAQELGLSMGPSSVVIGQLREANKAAREAVKDTNKGLKTTDLLASSIADGFAQMAVNIRSVGDIAKSVFKEMLASLVRIAAFRFFGGLLGGLFGGPAGAVAGATAGGEIAQSVSGSTAGQAAFTPFVVAGKWDGRDLLLGLERVRSEQQRMGVKI